MKIFQKPVWYLTLLASVFSLLTGCSQAEKGIPRNCPFGHKDIKQLEARRLPQIKRKNAPPTLEENRDAQGRLLFWIEYGLAVSPAVVCMVCEYGYYSQLDAWEKRCKTAPELWGPISDDMCKMALAIRSLMPSGLIYRQTIRDRRVVETRVQGWCSASASAVLDSFSASVVTQDVLTCQTNVLSNGLHEVNGSLVSQKSPLEFRISEKNIKGDVKTLFVIKTEGSGSALHNKLRKR